jgi:hypothetical protein
MVLIGVCSGGSDRSVFGWFYLIGVCSDGSDRSVFWWF